MNNIVNFIFFTIVFIGGGFSAPLNAEQNKVNLLTTTKTNPCGNNKQAQLLVELIRSDLAQQRTNIRCNPLLAKIALEKTTRMAEQGMVQHNLGGSPNSRLRQGGYQLPEYYGSAFSNQVEAIAGGYENARQVWRAFKASATHRQHLLGELEFYVEQDEIGVAFIKDVTTPHVEYWTIYLSKGYQANQGKESPFTHIPNKSPYDIIEIKK